MIEVIPNIRAIKFFQEKEGSDDFTVDPDIYYLDIIKRLKHEFIPKGEIVFDMGILLYNVIFLNYSSTFS